MTERDLIEVTNKTSYHPDDYQERFFIDEDNLDFDDEIKNFTFSSIFQKLQSFRSNIDPYLKSTYFLKIYLVYYFTVRDEVREEMDNIEQAINEIKDQILDLKSDIEDVDTELERVDGEFDEASTKLEDIANTNGIYLSRSQEHIDIRKQYDVDYEELSDDDSDEVDELFVEMEDLKDEYWGYMNDKSEYEDFLEKAKENLEEAKDWEGKLEGYSYD